MKTLALFFIVIASLCGESLVAQTLFLSSGSGGIGSTTAGISNVGIGRSDPAAMLHVWSPNSTIARFDYSGYTNYPRLIVSCPNINDIKLTTDGSQYGVNLVIGPTSYPNLMKLYDGGWIWVDGKFGAKEIQVALTVPWSDYVFGDNYKLSSLTEVETFIKGNKHLPGVPSEAEVKETGINVVEMDAILLKKIEELTLYMIDLKKENDILKKRIDALESQQTAGK